MFATLVQLTADIVSSHATGTALSSDDLIQEIEKVFTVLKRLEAEGVAGEAGESPVRPAMSAKKAFKNDQVFCMVCGKGGFKTLTRHLKNAHDLKPGQYRKQFNIPSSQALTAKNYSEARRLAANDNNLAANLEKARAVRAAKNAFPVLTEPIGIVAEEGKAKPEKVAKPAKVVKPAKVPAKSKKV